MVGHDIRMRRRVSSRTKDKLLLYNAIGMQKVSIRVFTVAVQVSVVLLLFLVQVPLVVSNVLWPTGVVN